MHLEVNINRKNMRNLATRTLLIGMGVAVAYGPCSAQQNEFKKYVWPGFAAQMNGSNTNATKYYATYQKTYVRPLPRLPQ